MRRAPGAAAEKAEWTFTYGGEALDVTEKGDELALAVLKGMTESVNSSRNEDAELPNTLRLVIKSE